MKTEDEKPCIERVPEKLCGGLQGDARPRCERKGPHKRHRAALYLRGVGKTWWEWKTRVQQPLVIELPKVRVRQFAPKQSVGKCSCQGVVHRCEPYNGLVRLG